MANFPPLKRYILYCIDRLIEDFCLCGPFLDVGCGSADVSAHLAVKSWQGKAIDISPQVIPTAQKNLSSFPSVRLEQASLFDEEETFNTVLLLDVLEHIEDDAGVLTKVYGLISEKGHLIVAVPSNPCEWRWDDEFYGHYRRYTLDQIDMRLHAAGFIPLAFWDFTYPVFWLMRRFYTAVKRAPRTMNHDKYTGTIASSCVNAWEIPLLSRLLSGDCILWQLIYALQFHYFKDYVGNGHEMIILSRKQEHA